MALVMTKDAVHIDAIKAARQRKGWSQPRLASVAGVSLGVVQNAERGGNITLRSAMALADALGGKVDDFWASDKQDEVAAGEFEAAKVRGEEA
jgi:transcriptional regulator with XRE-family HTH domain